MRFTVDYKEAMAEARRKAEGLEKAMFAILARTGEDFVTNARHNLKIDTSIFSSQRTIKLPGGITKKLPVGVHSDVTKNLRNSIGYVIYKDGRAVKENFEGGGEGEAAAKAELQKISKPAGYVLIGIAGMNYASYVESLGYNVITSQSIVFMMDLKKRLESLTKKTGTDFSLEFIGSSSSI